VSRSVDELGGMSANEIAYYADGVWYDAEYVHIAIDIPYYAGVAANAQGPVLELACGTGRLTIPMAQVGADVVGVDVMESMIEQANAKKVQLFPAEQERVEFLVGDMRSLRLNRKFKAVIIGFNTLMHLIDDKDMADTLETVREHLDDDGKFFLDLNVPLPSLSLSQDPEARIDPEQMIDPRDGRRFVVTENNQYDARQQIQLLKFFYQEVDQDGKKVGDEFSHTLRLRVIYPRELDLWLKNAGFEIVEDWDDFDKTTPFTAEGGRRVLVLQKVK